MERFPTDHIPTDEVSTNVTLTSPFPIAVRLFPRMREGAHCSKLWSVGEWKQLFLILAGLNGGIKAVPFSHSGISSPAWPLQGLASPGRPSALPLSPRMC